MRLFATILICFCASGCVTWNKCLRKFGKVEPQAIVLRDTVEISVPVPADRITGSIKLDTIYFIQHDTIVRTGDGGRAQIKFWVDKYKELLHYQANCLPDTVEVEKTIEIKGECPDVVVVDRANAHGWYWWWHTYQLFAAWALLLSAAAWIVYRTTKTYGQKDTTENH